MSNKSVFARGTVIATVLALAFSSLALTNVYAKGRQGKEAIATPATSSQANAALVQNSWKNEIAWLRLDSTLLGRVGRALEGIVVRVHKLFRSKRLDDRFAAGLDKTLKESLALLARGQAIAAAHAGFDASGAVTDQAQALKSVRGLGGILDQLRGTLLYRLRDL